MYYSGSKDYYMEKKLGGKNLLWFESAVVFVVVFVLFGVVGYFLGQQEQAMFFKSAVEKNMIWGAFVYVFLEILSIVAAPVATIFLIPIAVSIFGPFATSILNIIGWMIGSSIAFWLARKYGKPLLERMKIFQGIKKYENYVSSEVEFWSVLVLRVVFPVDVISYALGFLSSISFFRYFLATVIGIAPFSFLYSYAGEYFIMGQYFYFIAIVIFGMLFFGIFWYFLKRRK